MKNNRENGEVVVEASIVVTLVVLVITVMLYIGMVLYQQASLSIVANRTATNISQAYSNTLRDLFMGYVDPDSSYQEVTYSNMRTDAYLDSMRQKGTAFVQYRLKKTQIVPEVKRSVDVQVVNKSNEVLKGQVIVTITDTYNIPLVGLFKADGNVSFSTTGRAECVDYLEYLYGVEAIADPENSPIDSLPPADTCVVTFFKDEYSREFQAAVPVLRYKSIITSNNYSHSTMPKDPKLGDLKIKGWFTEDGGRLCASFTVEKSMTVYGKWDCEVKFDPTGGKVSPESKMVPYMNTTVLPTAEKDGFEFLGWFSDVEYSEEYSSYNGTGTQYFSGLTEISENITLYARWKCIHKEFDKTTIAKSDCLTRGEWLYECKTCNYSYHERGSYGECKAGSVSTQVEPSCTTPGYYVVNCVVCDRTLESGNIAALGHKYAANGTDYDLQYSREATCTREGVKGSRCSRCQTENGTILPKVPHLFEARCGVQHDLGDDSFYMRGTHNAANKTSYPTTKTVAAECVVCNYCGAFWSGTTDSNGIETEESCMRNGIEVSKGMYCYIHKLKNGKIENDSYYTEKYQPRPIYKNEFGKGVHD